VFGLTGLLDAAGSLTLALHFRHALANEHLSEARERIALRIVSGGLIVIGIGTIIESARRLTSGHPSNDSVLGAAVAACSIVALSALALRKRAVSPRIPSKALLADSWLSATGAGLAVIALAGTMFGTRENLSWVDPTCALIVALIAGAAGVGAMRSEESELTVE
jgi:divalent metal cation (Fe/Co/Zn/Cd) transporter